MKYLTRYALVLFIGIFVGAGVTLERAVFAERDAQEASNGLPLDELRTFTEVFNKIKTDYVVPVKDKKLIDDAIQGMLAGLDPHSAYLDKEGFREMRIGTEGRFGGLGIEVTMEDGFVKVVSAIDNTPAARAGLKTGDLIVRLNEQPVKGMSLNDAVKLMRGKPGTQIVLTLLRDGKPMKVTLTRAVIKIQSVKSKLFDKHYGYVRITQFQSNTGDALVSAVDHLKKESHGALKGIVLDLRNNPGGVLNAAVSVSDAFLNRGLIVYTQGRVPDSQLRLSATPGDVINGAPMVVLVNGGSASASEIVAGALQDHHRAIIMGTKTFGKGSVQTVMPMSNGGALKLTTARYYTPSGRSIQNTGITPDIVVDEARITKEKEPDMIREADLVGHLDNPLAPAPALPKTPEQSKAPKKTINKSKGQMIQFGDPKEDYQLHEALTLLRGVSFYRLKSGQ